MSRETRRTREAAWELLIENRDEVFKKLRWYLSKSTGRPVTHTGSWPNLQWYADGYFLGRLTLDYVEESVPGILEHLVYVLEAWNEEKGSVGFTIDMAVRQGTIKEFKDWQKNSSRQPIDRDDGGSWELHLVNDEDDSNPATYAGASPKGGGSEHNSAGRFNAAPTNALAYDPWEEDLVAETVTAQVGSLKAALSDEEFYALQRTKSDGASLTELAEDLDSLYPRRTLDGELEPTTKRRAQMLVDRAMTKARKAAGA